MAKDFKVRVLTDKSSGARSFVSDVYKIEGTLFLVYDPGTSNIEDSEHFVWVDTKEHFKDEITGYDVYMVTLYKSERTFI